MRSRIQNQEKTAPNGRVAVQVFADVEFGVLSKDCRNYGICRINIKRQLEQTPFEGASPCSSFSIITSNEDGIVEMIFLKASMTAASEEKYFGTGSFRIDEDVELPKEITESTSKPDKVIQRGNYNILNQAGAYIVRF